MCVRTLFISIKNKLVDKTFYFPLNNYLFFSSLAMAAQMNFLEPFNAIVYKDRIEITRQGHTFIFHHAQRTFTSERLKPINPRYLPVMLSNITLKVGLFHNLFY